MRFFLISTMGRLIDEDLAFVTAPPEGIGRFMYCMAVGERAGARYPSDPRVQLPEDHPGIKLASLLGNTNSYLILHRAAVDVVRGQCADQDIEYLPLELLDHRGRALSSDFSIVNPIGGVDCLDMTASELVRGPGGRVLGVTRKVLDPAKLGGLPHLFRMGGSTSEYVLSETLARAMKAAGLTNILLTRLEVAAG